MLFSVSLLTQTLTHSIFCRPFADLIHIQQNLSDPSQKVMLAELMGLTRERVMEFVERNAHEARRKFIKETLNKNPILLSVSAITFYCAALCQVFGDLDGVPVKLSTYTQITAYIMQVRYIL